MITGTVINVNMVEIETEMTITVAEGEVIPKKTGIIILGKMEGTEQIKYQHLQIKEINEKINRVANLEKHLIMRVINLM